MTVLLLSDRRDGTLIPRHPWWTALRTVSAVVTGAMGFYRLFETADGDLLRDLLRDALADHPDGDSDAGRKGGIRRGIAVIVGLLGVIIVLRPGSGDGFTLVHLAALGAATTGSLSSIIVRKIGRDERSVVLMLYPMVLTFVATGALSHSSTSRCRCRIWR